MFYFLPPLGRHCAIMLWTPNREKLPELYIHQHRSHSEQNQQYLGAESEIERQSLKYKLTVEITQKIVLLQSSITRKQV